MRADWGTSRRGRTRNACMRERMTGRRGILAFMSDRGYCHTQQRTMCIIRPVWLLYTMEDSNHLVLAQ